MANTNRIRRCNSRKEFEQLIDEYVTLGYSVAERGENNAAVIKKNFGSVTSHVIVAIATCWWTIFIGNIVWAVYNYYSKSDRVLIKIDE